MKLGDCPVATVESYLDLRIIVSPEAVDAVANHSSQEIQVEQRIGEPRPLSWRGQRENGPLGLSAKRGQQTVLVRLQPRLRQPQIARVNLGARRSPHCR